MRVAAIDIGTNSVLLLIAERRGDEVVRVRDIATITRLGEGVDHTGRLSTAAVTRTLACLGDYADTIRGEQIDRVRIVGTSAMRDAAGGSDFVARATEILGSAPEVISGEREAELTFSGALTALTALDTTGPIAVFDIGGGSTEVIVGARAGQDVSRAVSLERAVSLDIGSVRLTERHLKSDPPTREELDAVRADVSTALRDAPSTRGLPLVGVAGTITTLAAVAQAIDPYDGNAVHGSRLTRDDLASLLEQFTSCTLEGRKELPGLHPKRADVIIAGTLIADAICERAEAQFIIVSDRGVRWGLAQELALRR